MRRMAALLALSLFTALPCLGQQSQGQVSMSIQEARKLVKRAWENRDQAPDLAIRLIIQVLQYYPGDFEVRLPEYLDEIWRTQGEEAYHRAVSEGLSKDTLHPSEMAHLVLDGLLAVIYLYNKKDGRSAVFWAKQTLRRFPESPLMNWDLYRGHELMKRQGLPQKPDLFVNGKFIKAVIEFQKQAALVAVQDLKKALNLQISYDAQQSRVAIKKGTKEAAFELGKKWGLVKGELKEMSSVPYMKGNLIMVPVEVLAELMEGRAYWDEETKLVYIFFPPD